MDKPIPTGSEVLVAELRDLVDTPFEASCCNSQFPILSLRRALDAAADMIETLTAAQQPVQEGGGEAEFALRALVAAGHVLQRHVDQARAIARDLGTAPPSAPVGVEAVVAEMREWVRASERQGDSEYSQAWRTVVVQEWAYKLEALTQQPAQAAPEGGEYRLLRRGDVVQADDEVLHDNCTRWIELAGWEIGMVYDPLVFVPVRRKAPTPPGDDAAGGGQ